MSNKSKSTTFLLCYFLGGLGVHRFYLGKFITGILMLLTAGGLMIWWLIDLIMIIRGRMKDKAGNDLRIAQPYADQPNAGFWVRFAAITVDGLILMLITLVFVFVPLWFFIFSSMPLDPAAMTTPEGQAAMAGVLPIIVLAEGVMLLVNVGYFVILTAGKHQGTIGKRSMGIYVRKRDGGRVWYGSSIVRYVGYIISSIPLMLGYLMAGFHKRKLALHDLIAGTEVVYGTPEGAPAVVSHEAVTEVADAEPAPEWESEPDALPATMAEEKQSRTPEILVGTGLLLIAGSVAFAYMR